MTKYKLVAYTNSVSGKDEAFNAWYDKQHIRDVCAIPGILSAERMTCVGEGAHRYMTIYEIETDDIDGVMAELGQRAGTEAMPITDALDEATAAATVWRPMA